MPLDKAHKARTRAHILQAAGKVFRRAGYAGTSVDAVMAEAGLTRGGFYAHFDSKSELFATVLGHDHGLIRQLARRNAGNAQAWAKQTRTVLSSYLDNVHRREVREGCSFAALTTEAGRGGPEARAACRHAFRALVDELLRTPGAPRIATARSRRLAAHIAASSIGIALVVGAMPESPDARRAQREARGTVLALLAELFAAIGVLPAVR